MKYTVDQNIKPVRNIKRNIMAKIFHAKTNIKSPLCDLKVK